MQWQALLRQGYIAIDGRFFDLRHLLGHFVEIHIPSSGAYASACVTMRVEYSSHCVSVGAPVAGRPLDFEVLGPARRMLDHRGMVRAFCYDRYRWSLGLPSIVAALGSEKCYFTPHANWLVVKLIDDKGRMTDYEVFFSLRRGVEAGTLRMIVESAYVRDASRAGIGKPNTRRDVIKFMTLAAKIARGESARNPGLNARGFARKRP